MSVYTTNLTEFDMKSGNPGGTMALTDMSGDVSKGCWIVLPNGFTGLNTIMWIVTSIEGLTANTIIGVLNIISTADTGMVIVFTAIGTTTDPGFEEPWFSRFPFRLRLHRFL
jgi:hypothetical protein